MDFNHAGLEGLTLKGDMRAIVIKRNDPKRMSRVGVYIIKLMDSFTSDPKEQEALDVAKKNDVDYDMFSEVKAPQPIKYKNFLWAKPETGFSSAINGLRNTSGSVDVPQIGSVIYVYFEDNDPQKLRYTNRSPMLNNDRTSVSNLSSQSLDDPDKFPNVHIIKEYPNGTVLGVDYNEGENSFFLIMDKGHRLTINNNEKESKFVLSLQNGNHIIIDDTEEDIDININRDYTGNFGRNYNNTVTENTTFKSKNINLNASQSINIKAGVSITLEAPNLIFKGKINSSK
jgi:hypothetical protein